MISIQRSPASTAYDDSKRAQGNRHTQAVLARPTTRQRALGHAPRPPFLQRTTALTRSRRMTNRIGAYGRAPKMARSKPSPNMEGIS
jgi:hypothetical protein